MKEDRQEVTLGWAVLSAASDGGRGAASREGGKEEWQETMGSGKQEDGTVYREQNVGGDSQLLVHMPSGSTLIL